MCVSGRTIVNCLLFHFNRLWDATLACKVVIIVTDFKQVSVVKICTAFTSGTIITTHNCHNSQLSQLQKNYIQCKAYGVWIIFWLLWCHWLPVIPFKRVGGSPGVTLQIGFCAFFILRNKSYQLVFTASKNIVPSRSYGLSKLGSRL